ncbi:MAG TPA: helix-turn-helix domain-containing protein, partial [Clostridia bacterium]|nr:helix-turn-helix domain-containing protein [Clostridia bacterium]
NVETLNGIRIDRARSLLRETDLPVHIVGGRVGFSNTTYFIRVFRKCTGKTPNEYRASEREGL